MPRENRRPHGQAVAQRTDFSCFGQYLHPNRQLSRTTPLDSSMRTQRAKQVVRYTCRDGSPFARKTATYVDPLAPCPQRAAFRAEKPISDISLSGPADVDHLAAAAGGDNESRAMANPRHPR